MAGHLSGDPREAAERLLGDAVHCARAQRNRYADNTTTPTTRIT
ncbi:hypothetical protein [Streptomyces sp. NPDC093071]